MRVSLDALPERGVLILELIESGKHSRDEIVRPIEGVLHCDGELLPSREGLVNRQWIRGPIIWKHAEDAMVGLLFLRRF